jgi:uncharacterized membrane protein
MEHEDGDGLTDKIWRILISDTMTAVMLVYATIVLLACGWDAMSKRSPYLGAFAIIAGCYVASTVWRKYHEQ